METSKPVPHQPSAAPASATPPQLPPPPSPGQSQPVPLAPPVVAKLPFGGNVGRKLRYDGLKSGSPEALAADRQRDAARKRAERAVKAAATPPPPLPPSTGAPPPVAGPSAPQGVPVDFDGSGAGSASGVPWQADSLKPLFEQLVEAAEESRVASFIGHCKEAGILGKLVKEIEADAHFPKAAKLLLCRSLPRLAAKWLNQIGLSAEYEDEIAVVSAVILIVGNDRRLSARLDAVIAENKAAAKTEAKAGNA